MRDRGGGMQQGGVEVDASKLTVALHPSSCQRLDPIIGPRRQQPLSCLRHQCPDGDLWLQRKMTNCQQFVQSHNLAIRASQGVMVPL